MKARLIRDMPKLVREEKQRNGKTIIQKRRIPVGQEGCHKEGDIIEGPNVFLLVKQGVAEPEDEECAEAAGMTPERFEAAKKTYPRTAKGIVPDDFAAYEQGLMDGYIIDAEGNGKWKPGPNWYEGCEEEYAAVREEQADE